MLVTALFPVFSGPCQDPVAATYFCDLLLPLLKPRLSQDLKVSLLTFFFLAN